MGAFDPRDRGEVDAAKGSRRDRERERDNADANRGLKAGYTSGNPYPGYRGPTGTRNPKAKPERAPMKSEKGYSPTDTPKPSFLDKMRARFAPRRVANPTPSYAPTLHNMSVLAGLTPGPGLPAKIAGMIAGVAPQFEKYTGAVMGPGDWDKSEAIRVGLPDFAKQFYNRLPR